MSAEREPEPPRQDPVDNPTSEELDVEGPNESAPGHEPPESAADEDDGSSPSAGGRA